MTTSDYRKWIEAGFKNYGKDPWFFIRELAQNSRDAGAGTIRVKAGHTSEKNEILIFEDDGQGMTFAHAVRYLFRLYASSKGGEKNAAGMFGIGFWTVLKFNPSKIIIESRFKNESWGVTVDPQLNTSRVISNLPGHGTRITLVRPAVETSGAVFLDRVEEALVHYCSYLRRNNLQASPLPVMFEGKNITGPMKLPGPVSLGFKTRQVEGVVGLGPRPLVNLYARGLPVWQGTTLEELSHTPQSSRVRSGGSSHWDNTQITEGLAPVFLLNGNNLEVNISRRRVIDNRALQKVGKTAEDALTQLVEMVADTVSPRKLRQRLYDRFKKITASVLGSFWKSLLVGILIILPLEYILLKTFYKKEPGRTQPRMLSMQVEDNRYSGASVNAMGSAGRADIIYHPPTATWFKLFHAESYAEASGFSQTFSGANAVSFPALNCGEKFITIELKAAGPGTLLLPRPLFHNVVPGSITLDGKQWERGSGALFDSQTTGGAVVTIPRGGVIRYRCCPLTEPAAQAERAPPAPEARQRLTDVPQNLITNMPDNLKTVLEESVQLNTFQKVQTAARLTVGLIEYDESFDTAKKYSDTVGDWFQTVITVGAGDCDILNSVTILLLRRMGVPARLAVGLIGENGRVLPGMHAWTEYFDNGWQHLDVTAYAHGAAPREGERETVAEIPEFFKQLPPDVLTPVDTDTQSPPPVFTPPASPAPSGGSTAKRRTQFPDTLVLSILSVVFLLSLFYILLKRKPWDEVLEARGAGGVAANLAGMVLHALLHPNAWGSDANIRNVRIIPTITGAALSLRGALALSRAGKLFYIGKSNLLADDMRSWKLPVPIMEAGYPDFDPIIKALPEAVNLDGITALRAKMPEGADHGVLGKLLTAVNGLISPPCLVAPGLVGDEFYDVDLSALISRSSYPGWEIPSRFIAVNPDGGRVRDLAVLFETNPELAQFRLIDILLKESLLIAGPAERVLQKTAKRLIKSFAGSRGGFSKEPLAAGGPA
ncbi:MAG: hypothetical protein GY950_17230, partial [bacterium]|nr:hypothetical protein [bacterium]